MPLEQLPPHRILIVVHYEDRAKELATQLRKAGHIVEIAYDGPSALELAPTFRPEMVMIELSLSGMDAFAVARSLRAQTNRDLKLVSVMYGDCDYDEADWEACFDNHMNKLKGTPLLMRGRIKLADISPEEWVQSQNLLSRDDFIRVMLLAVVTRPFEPQFAPDELAPLIPDEVLCAIRWLTGFPANLSDYVANKYRVPNLSPDDAWESPFRRLLFDEFTDEDIAQGVSRWLRFFNP